MSGELHAPGKPVALVGIELCTPLGIDTRSSLAEMAAGSDAFFEPDPEPSNPQPVRASRRALIPLLASRTERLLQLSASAFSAHLGVIEGIVREGVTTLPVVLAHPELDSAGSFELGPVERALVEVAAERLPGVRLNIMTPGAGADGRAGPFHAIAKALELLASGSSAVVVGGVDSLCDPESLGRLLKIGRVLGPANGDGLIPGEAAGFGLLVPRELQQQLGLAGVEIAGVSLAREVNHLLQERPNLGDGLTTAFRLLREHPSAGAVRPKRVLTCQSGETGWGEEFSRAYLRNAALMPEPLELAYVAHTLGETGAAGALVQLAIAAGQAGAIPSERGTADPSFLVYGCSDFGAIGACLVHPLPAAVGRVQPSPPRTWSEPEQELARVSLEHQFEEIGFLLTQRQAYFENPRIPWTEAAKLEERIRAHVAAVAAWDREILLGCAGEWLADASDDDRGLGIVFALVSLSSELDPWPFVGPALERSDAPAIAWLAVGLEQAMGGPIHEGVVPFLNSGRPELQAAAARVLGARREGGGEALHDILGSEGLAPAARDAASLALAKLGARGARFRVEQLLAQSPGSAGLVEAALLLGVPSALDAARRAIQSDPEVEPGQLLVLGMAGDPGDLTVLAGYSAADAEGRCDQCAGLGALGAPGAVMHLIGRLEDDDDAVRGAAAAALQRITGADLYEKAPLFDEPDEDEPYDGPWDERVSRDVSEWNAWWRANSASLSSPRLRAGRPFALELCVEELESKHTTLQHRSLAARELQLRLGAPLPCEFDAFHEVQRAGITKTRALCAEGGSR